MTFTIAVIPFAVAVVIVSMIALLLKINIKNISSRIVVGADANVCGNLSVTPCAVRRVTNMNSIPNDLLRDNKSISCLDYLCIQEVAADGDRNEDTILKGLGGII